MGEGTDFDDAPAHACYDDDDFNKWLNFSILVTPMHTLTNSEDLGEMPHNVTFHQDLLF